MGIGGVLIATFLFAPRLWVFHCAWAILVARGGAAAAGSGYLIPVIRC
jgi:hypothetical protein